MNLNLSKKKSDNEDLAPVEKVQPQVEENKLIGEDRLKAGEISISEFIPLNGLNYDDYDGWRVGDTTQKTQYQTLISEMLDVADKHIALAEKKFASTPQERKAKENTLMVWRDAITAIQVIQRKYENPFTTALAVRRDIPKLLKQRFEKKFANLSDAEKYNQAELQSDLNYAHRVNKAIEWVLKEKSKEADNTIADKAQPQQSTSEPVAAEQESTKTEEKPAKSENGKKLIGKNTEGNNVYEDANGIRFVDNGGGFLVGESVGINIGNKQNPYDTSARTDEHRTAEEVAARQPKRPKIGDEGYTSDMANEDLAELYLQQERNGMIEDDRLNKRIKNLEKVFYELRANEPKVS